MQEIFDYKIRPVKKILSGQIKFEDGPMLKHIKLMKEIGLISGTDFKILRAIKKKEALNLDSEELKRSLRRLRNMKLIVNTKEALELSQDYNRNRIIEFLSLLNKRSKSEA